MPGGRRASCACKPAAVEGRERPSWGGTPGLTLHDLCLPSSPSLSTLYRKFLVIPKQTPFRGGPLSWGCWSAGHTRASDFSGNMYEPPQPTAASTPARIFGYHKCESASSFVSGPCRRRYSLECCSRRPTVLLHLGLIQDSARREFLWTRLPIPSNQGKRPTVVP